MIKLAISGCCGRMGKRIFELACEDKDFEITALIERKGIEAIGQVMLNSKIKISDNIWQMFDSADVLIDFTSPDSTLENIKAAIEKRKAIVVGTTGLTEADIEKINQAAKKIPIVFAANMSVGVNLLFSIVGEVTKKLGIDYNIEIVEAHHKFKKDAPSGTAKELARIISEARQRDLKDIAVYGREGIVGARTEDEIGIHSVRAGDIVGEHTVTFCAQGERIELTHKAHSRDTFALGALRAAKFLAGKEYGLYNMQDVLRSIE